MIKNILYGMLLLTLFSCQQNNPIKENTADVSNWIKPAPTQKKNSTEGLALYALSQGVDRAYCSTGAGFGGYYLDLIGVIENGVLKEKETIEHSAAYENGSMNPETKTFIEKNMQAGTRLFSYQNNQWLGDFEILNLMVTSCQSLSVCAAPKNHPLNITTGIVSNRNDLGVNSKSENINLTPDEQNKLIKISANFLFEKYKPKGVTVNELQLTASQMIKVNSNINDDIFLTYFHAGRFDKRDPKCTKEQTESMECDIYNHFWLALIDKNGKIIFDNYWTQVLPDTNEYLYKISVEYIDVLDIDGDGTSELFFKVYGYESFGYRIYKFNNSKLELHYEGGGGGC